MVSNVISFYKEKMVQFFCVIIQMETDGSITALLTLNVTALLDLSITALLTLKLLHYLL